VRYTQDNKRKRERERKGIIVSSFLALSLFPSYFFPSQSAASPVSSPSPLAFQRPPRSGAVVARREERCAHFGSRPLGKLGLQRCRVFVVAGVAASAAPGVAAVVVGVVARSARAADAAAEDGALGSRERERGARERES
jgi:hypothetical protein